MSSVTCIPVTSLPIREMQQVGLVLGQYGASYTGAQSPGAGGTGHGAHAGSFLI